MTTFGNTTIEAGDHGIKDSICAFQATCPGTFRAVSIVAAIKNLTALNKLAKCAIYNMSDNLVAQTEELTIPPTLVYSWFTFPFTIPPNLSSQDYQLACWGDNGVPFYMAKANDVAYSVNAVHLIYAPLFPDPAVWTASQNQRVSIYCNLSAVLGGNILIDQSIYQNVVEVVK